MVEVKARITLVQLCRFRVSIYRACVILKHTTKNKQSGPLERNVTFLSLSYIVLLPLSYIVLVPLPIYQCGDVRSSRKPLEPLAVNLAIGSSLVVRETAGNVNYHPPSPLVVSLYSHPSSRTL